MLDLFPHSQHLISQQSPFALLLSHFFLGWLPAADAQL